MKHLYFFFAAFTYWDAEKNFRRGEISGVTEAERRIDSGVTYHEWRERTQGVIETDHGQKIGNLVIKSLSYLGEAK